MPDRKYRVLVTDKEELTYTSLGVYEAGTQKKARDAAVRANPHIREQILGGEDVHLVAAANFDVRPARVRNREPSISV